MIIILDLSNFPYSINVVGEEEDPLRPMIFHEEDDAERYAEEMIGMYQLITLEE